jgi:hypothetical protein
MTLKPEPLLLAVAAMVGVALIVSGRRAIASTSSSSSPRVAAGSPESVFRGDLWNKQLSGYGDFYV